MRHAVDALHAARVGELARLLGVLSSSGTALVRRGHGGTYSVLRECTRVKSQSVVVAQIVSRLVNRACAPAKKLRLLVMWSA